MSELNPYESFLEGRTVDAILDATANEIARHLTAIGAKRASVPAMRPMLPTYRRIW